MRAPRGRESMSLMLFAILFAACPGDDEWKVGVATTKITPDEPLLMAGYGQKKPFEAVHDDLYAKAIAFEDSRGNRALLVTADLIGWQSWLAEPICRQISTKTGLQREQILLSVIHVHSGPTLSLDPEPSRGVPPEQQRKTVEYTRKLQQLIVDLGVRAASTLAPARLSWGTGVAGFVMNRREPTPEGIILGVNPRGLVDRSVPVLRADGEDGKPRAILFGCACHNTTLSSKNLLLSGDYGGFAQRQVEELHPGAVALMMLGCAGDANPYPRGTMDMARESGTSLGREVSRVLRTKLHPLRGPLKTLLENAALPLQEPPSHDELTRLAKSGPGEARGTYRRMLELVDKGQPPPSKVMVPIALWQFGQDLTMVGLSGEVVVDYVAFLEKALGPLDLWVASYCNNWFGYLPSARVLSEGGYESAQLYSGGPGIFAPAAEEALVKMVRALAERAGRKLPSTH